MGTFTIKTATLQGVINKAVKGASNSKFSVITSLMNVIVESGRINVTTTDSDNYLTISDDIISGDDVEFTVSVETFSKLVSKTSVENVKISVTEDMIQFVGNGTYKIPIQLDADGSPIKYPKYTVNTPDVEGTIKVSTIKDIILHNKMSLAVTMEAPYLTGYLCDEDCVVSADTLNICVNKIKTFGKKVLVSPNVFELLSMCDGEDISYKITDTNGLFETKNLRLFVVFMSGCSEYPLERIIPYAETSYPSSCTLSKSTMLNVIDRLSLFINDDDQNGIYMTFTKDGVKAESVARNGLENIPYQGSENFKDFTCLVGVDSLKKQISSRLGESFTLYYGDESSMMLKDGNASQIMALLDDEDETAETGEE